ncbi:MAG TPA: Mth938-like domain-containing protein [Usitatibacteraceae bacterium]
MKLHLNTSDGLHTITGHGEGYVAVNQQKIEHALIVMPAQLINPWTLAYAAAVSLADFEVLLEIGPELVVFGSGPVFRFPDQRIMVAFSQRRIGFEVMDTPAACRTYNVLMSEGRNVAAALLV